MSPEQQALIAAQYDQLQQLSAGAGNPRFAALQARMGFNRRQCGKAFPQTVAEAIRLIEGQKAYMARLQEQIGTRP